MRKPLEEVVGYHFRDPELLKEALTHKSYASESKSGLYNERLEFLGDSTLAAVVAHELYALDPDADEGALSKRKSQIVSRPTLARWAAELNLGAYLHLGVGEETSGGRSRHSLLSNALEALIGAVYIDGGYQAAGRLIRHCLRLHGSPEETDHKSRLQEVLQKKYKVPPAYELAHSAGPEHDKTFQVVVHLGRKALGKGSGKTKKEAEQAAAQDALKSLHIPED